MQTLKGTNKEEKNKNEEQESPQKSYLVNTTIVAV